MAAPDGAASFSVDLARAPQAIADLKDARNQLHAMLEEASRLSLVVPPAHDPVSRDAATVLGRVAHGGPGSLFDALNAGVEQLSGMITSMEQELASYRGTESDNVRAFGSSA